LEHANVISKLNIQVIAEGRQGCLRELEGYTRGRARRRARNHQREVDLVVVAMCSAVHAEEKLARLEQDHTTAPVITVVGDDPSWDRVGGTMHLHRDEEIIPAINRLITLGKLPN